MNSLLNNISALVAKFYNWLPSRLRVYFYNSLSGSLATILGLLSRDLINQKTSNEYLLVFILAVSGLLNEVQMMLKERGDRVLAKDGNPRVLEVYNEKVKTAQKIQSVAEKNQS